MLDKTRQIINLLDKYNQQFFYIAKKKTNIQDLDLTEKGTRTASF